MMQEVFKVDVVVINLIYYLVVLKYDQNGNWVFVVVVKGGDELVMYICKIVIVYDVFLVVMFMLIWVIYYIIEVDEEILYKLFMVVVQVLVYVFQLKVFKVGKGKCFKLVLNNLLILLDMCY